MLEVDHLHFVLLTLFGGATALSLGLRLAQPTIHGRFRMDAHALVCLSAIALTWNSLVPSLFAVSVAQTLCLTAQWRMPAVLGFQRRDAWHAPATSQLETLLILCVLAAAAFLARTHNFQWTISIVGHATTMVAALRVMRVARAESSPSGLARRLILVAGGLQLLAQGIFLSARLCQATLVNHPSEVAPLSIALPLTLMLMAAISGMVGQAQNTAQCLLDEQVAAAQMDPLTGLPHRGALNHAAVGALSQLALRGGTLTCLAIDVDRFKQINDTAGHLAGDAILTRIAQALKDNCRSGDVIGRFGGEEFCVLCPDTNAYEASVVAERIRKTIEAISLPAAIGGQTTVSIGVAQTRVSRGTLRLGHERWEQLFDRADRALYRAKQAGRNRVVWAPDTEGDN